MERLAWEAAMARRQADKRAGPLYEALATAFDFSRRGALEIQQLRYA